MSSLPVHSGLAVSWAISTTGIATGAGIGAAVKSWRFEEQEAEKTCQKELHYDGSTGSVIGSTRFQFVKTMRLRVYPWSSTEVGAESASILPAAGDEITITDTADTDVAGVYEVERASKIKRFNNKVYIDLDILVHGDNENGISHGSPANTRISSPVA